MAVKHRSVLMIAGLLAACVGTPVVPENTEAQDEKPVYDLGQPYIGGALPGGDLMVAGPPEPESLAMQIDYKANAQALQLIGSPRWDLAARDADLGPNWYGNAYSCAAGVTISPEATPRIADLVRRAATDFGRSTGAVKAQFQRKRPFEINDKPICTPQDEELLRGNGSYPSGHAAIGYGTGMVLASLFPDRASALLARGAEYGASRWVCNVHWKSDAEISQSFAAAILARLQSNAEYQRDYAAALEEAKSLTAAPEAAACEMEAEALNALR